RRARRQLGALVRLPGGAGGRFRDLVLQLPPAVPDLPRRGALPPGRARRHDRHSHGHGPVEPHESPLVVTVPLVLLAIPSIAIGFLTVGPMLFGGFFADSILVREANDHLGAVGEELFHGALAFGLHFWASPAFW